MFEAIIQRILKRIFGNFIQGLDSKKLNLGLLSGKLLIENVSIKKQILQMFALPFIIIESNIRKIGVYFPLNNISSPTVQITLEAVFVLITQRQKDKKLSERQIIEDIETNLKNVVKEFKKRLTENQKSMMEEKNQKKGFFQNIVIKILDNLRIQIKNVHIRFQDSYESKFSCGITLDSIEIYTCNTKRQRSFIDRTSNKSSKQVLHKALDFVNLGFYWNAYQSEFIKDMKDKQKIVQRFQQNMSNKNRKFECNYLIMINTKSLLKQCADKDYRTPMYEIEFKIAQIRIKVSKLIIQQFLSLVQLKNDYDLVSNSKDNRQIPLQYKPLFDKYNKMQQNDKLCFTNQEAESFNGLLLQYRFDNIANFLVTIIKQQYKDQLKIKFKKRKDSDLLQQQDLSLQLQSLVQKISKIRQQNGLPENYVYLISNIKMLELAIFIVDQHNISQFSVCINEIGFYLQFTQAHQTYSFTVKDLKVYGRERKIILWRETAHNKDFLKIQLTQQVKIQKVVLKINIQSIISVYDTKTIQYLKQFSSIKIQSQIKNKALDKVDQLSNQMQKNLNSIKANLDIQLNIDVPKIILPESKNQWNVQFGRIFLSMKSSNILIKLQQLRAEFSNSYQSFDIIKPFNVALEILDEKINICLPSILIQMTKAQLLSLNNLVKLLTIMHNKSQILIKSSKKAIVYLKQKNWKKCMAAICDSKLYFWDKRQYPLAVVRIRKVLLTNDKYNEQVIWISDKKKTNYIFKIEDPAKAMQWTQELTKISNLVIHNQSEMEVSSSCIHAKIQIKQISFKCLDNKHFQLVNAQISNIEISIQKQRSIMKNLIQIQSIIVRSSKQIILKKKTAQHLLSIHHIIQQNTSELQNKIDQQISVKLSKFQAVYNPIFIIKILSFFDLQELKFQKESIFDQETLQKQNQVQILVQIEVQIQGLDIILINKKTSLHFARASLETSKIQFRKYYYEEVIQGTLGDLIIQDLTNYPNTIYEPNCTSPVVPKKIWGSISQKNYGLLDFKKIKLIQGSDKIKDGIYNRLVLKIFAIKFNYLHEPVLRIIDYLQVQLLGVISNPDFFDEYHMQNLQAINVHQYRKFIKKREETVQIKNLQSLGKQKVVKSLEDPRELFLDIEFSSPQLLLNDQEGRGIEISFDKIKIVNQFFYSTERVFSKSIKKVLCQRYIFCFEQLNVKLIDAQNHITQQSFNINMKLEMFLKEQEYRFITEEKLTLDMTFAVKLLVTPIYMQIEQNTIKSILKILELNILHQDGIQYLMIHDYIKGDPIKYIIQIDLEDLNLSLVEFTTAVVEFDVEGVRVIKKKMERESLQVNIISIETKFLKNNQYKQLMSKRKSFRFTTNRRNLSQSFFQNSRVFQIATNQLNKQLCLNYVSTEGELEHNHKIKINDLTLIFELEFLIFLKKFTDLQKIQKLSKVIEYEEPKQVCKLKVTYNIEFCKSLLSFQISNTEILMNVYFSVLIAKDQKDFRIFGKDIEIFFCVLNQIRVQNMQNMKKRTFLQKFHIQLENNNRQSTSFVEISISKIILKFSIKDIKNVTSLFKDTIASLKTLQDGNQNASQQIKKSYDKIEIVVKNSQSLEILLINDTSQKYFPIIYMYMELLKQLSIEYDNDKVMVELDYKIFSRYYNLKISTWQPIVEETELSLRINYNTTDVHKSEFLFEKSNKSKYMRVDITTNLIETLIKTLNDIEIQFKAELSDELENDCFNTWIVQNYTGYAIKCIYESNKITVDNDSKQQFVVKGDKLQKNIIESKDIDIYIDMRIGNKYFVKDINIKSEDIERLKIQAVSAQWLFKVVKFNISKNIKYISFFSSMIVLNHTTLDFIFHLDNDNKSMFVSGSTKSLPFDSLLFCFRLQYNQIISQKIDFRKYSRQLKMGDICLNLCTIQQQGINRLVISAPTKIASLFPVALCLNFKTACNYYESNFQVFDPKKLKFESMYHQVQQMEVSYYVEGFQWTDLDRFVEGERTLEDKFGRKVNFQVDKIISNDNLCNQFFIYPHQFIENNSQQKVIICHEDKKKIANQNEKDPSKIVLLPHLKGFIVRQIQSELYSRIIKVGQNTQSFILALKKTYLGDKVIVYMSMVIIPSIINFQGLTIKKYVIQSKYRLTNKTFGQLIIRHADAFTTETIKIQMGEDSNIYWFEEEYYNKSIRITLNAQNWEWSAPLNIENPGVTNFILRDRSNYKKILFMHINIKVKDSIYKIEIKQLHNNQQYPFLIINQLEEVNIFIPSLRSTLKNVGQQCYYSWDDPLKQLYQIDLLLQPKLGIVFKQKLIVLKEKKVQNEVIQLKTNKGILKIQIDIFTKLNQKIFRFRLFEQLQITKPLINIMLNLKIAISFINNSLERTVNLFSLYTDVKFQYKFSLRVGQEYKRLILTFQELQIDNNTHFFVYYPVVLKSNFTLKGVGKQSWIEFQIIMDKIKLMIEQDFFYEVCGAYSILNNFFPATESKSNFSISRLILPKIMIDLGIQAKKISIETPIILSKPEQCSYPWQTFPYPIKGVILSLLSSMSISPLNFISSLHEGIVHLFNDASTSRGVEGFISKVIESFGIGINGMVRILVGDMERIQNFIDGVESGVYNLTRTTFSVFNILRNDPSIVGLIKTSAGCFYLPLTGLLQLTLKISEGIKNTARFRFELQDVQNRKMNPITFFGKHQYYQEYDTQSGQIIALLHFSESGKYKQIMLVDYAYLSEVEQSVLILSTQEMLMLSLKQKKYKWVLQLSNISNIKIKEQTKSVQLYVKEQNEYFSNGSITIIFNSQKDLKNIYQNIFKLLKS